MRDRYTYHLAPEVRAALDAEKERTGAPYQVIIDRAVRAALGVPSKAKKGARVPKKRGA